MSTATLETPLTYQAFLDAVRADPSIQNIFWGPVYTNGTRVLVRHKGQVWRAFLLTDLTTTRILANGQISLTIPAAAASSGFVAAKTGLNTLGTLSKMSTMTAIASADQTTNEAYYTIVQITALLGGELLIAAVRSPTTYIDTITLNGFTIALTEGGFGWDGVSQPSSSLAASYGAARVLVVNWTIILTG